MSPDSPILSVLQKDVEYRRKRQWDVFSWSSTLLVAIIGGLIAIKTSEHPHSLRRLTQVIITAAVVVLGGYAYRWIYDDAKRQVATVDLLNKVAKLEPEEHKYPALGYRGAIILLAVVAVLAVWFPL